VRTGERGRANHGRDGDGNAETDGRHLDDYTRNVQ
jgi:hypothetical protein